MLSGCALLNRQKSNSSSIEGQTKTEDKYYALFMYNYPRMEVETPSGNGGMTDNLLYLKQEIKLNETIAKPEKDPERENYLFKGWYKENACENAWDFQNDKATASTFLYAKWEVYIDETYIEPEYHHPETIVSECEGIPVFTVTNILNEKVIEGVVNLTTGGINRLIAHHEDVKFAIGYERVARVTMTSAVYDIEQKEITVIDSDSNSYKVKVNDASASYVISDNSIYESKAQKYEQNGADFENYHIMLAGSSSMEYWTTSTKDMNPIVSYNTGIGGTTVEQWSEKLLHRLVLPYSPKAVVYYVGVNNIINSGDNGTTTGDKLEALFNETHKYLPNATIFYVLINKLPGYMSYQQEFDIANNRALTMAKNNTWLRCIDAGHDLLKANGEPHHAYFRTDGLHMSQYGYVLWGGAIKKSIIEWLG